MKRREVVIVICSILIFGFLFSRDSLARVAWQKYHSPAAALVLASQDTKLLMNLGSYYFSGAAYDLKRAKRAYEKALRQDAKILWGHYQLARIYLVEGNFGEALREINLELRHNPDNLRSLYVRGLIYAYQKQWLAAEDDFLRFTKWSPKEWAGYNDLGWVYASQGKYAEAETIARTAFDQASGAGENPWLWNSLGVALLNQGEYESAARAFENAKVLSLKLDEKQWHAAYPGNNIATARAGIQEFQLAILKNLKTAGKLSENLSQSKAAPN